MKNHRYFNYTMEIHKWYQNANRVLVILPKHNVALVLINTYLRNDSSCRSLGSYSKLSERYFLRTIGQNSPPILTFGQNGLLRKMKIKIIMSGIRTCDKILCSYVCKALNYGSNKILSAQGCIKASVSPSNFAGNTPTFFNFSLGFHQDFEKSGVFSSEAKCFCRHR